MQYTMLTTTRRALSVSTIKRCLSSQTPNRIGVIKPRNSDAIKPASSASHKQQSDIEMLEYPDASTTVPFSTSVKNGVMATGLFGLVFGIAFYSMYAVGQSGAIDDDMVAVLEKEAAVAQEKLDRENRNNAETQEMLAKFNAGLYDPDRYEELEAEMEAAEQAKKRPWWKFW